MGVKNKIKVLIVDDSAIVRKILRTELAKHPDIDVVGTAPDPFIARNKIISLQPDVLTLDVAMPKMDGITFLKKLMAQHPMPVIILSSMTPQNGQTAMEAFDAGAIDVICKPGPSHSVIDVCQALVEKIKAAAKAHIERTATTPCGCPLKKQLFVTQGESEKIFALGASTGGVQALTKILSSFPANAPGTLIVQHMPEHFTASFAERLDTICSMQVKEAENGDIVTPGRVLLAPGNKHMLLTRAGDTYIVNIKFGPEVCRQRPSVEVLFNSIARSAGSNAIGAILTGMANDGAKGLLAMRQAGARTIAQDETSCIVFGMPREAIKIDAAEKIVPLNQIAETMIQLAQNLVNV